MDQANHNIEEHCFSIAHPVTKQTITQYKKLQHDPDLKHLWVPAMSKEVHPLFQGKEGVTKATNTIFFLSHKEIRCTPTNHTVMYACIVIDHCYRRRTPTAFASLLAGILSIIHSNSPLVLLTWSLQNSFGTAQSAPKVHILLALTSPRLV